jgi:hypothetical protein
MKQCSNCKEIKNLEFFGTRPDGKLKKRSWCKYCEKMRRQLPENVNKDKIRSKALWRKIQTNPELRQTRLFKIRESKKKQPNYWRKDLLKRYNLTVENYNKLVVIQNNKCKICQVLPRTYLYVDHCHKTGIIRGLLCQKCNSGIGLLQDSVEILQKAINYLKGV